MSLLGRIHSRFVHSNRVLRLAEICADHLPESGRVLEVGCGDGRISKLIGKRKPGLDIVGIEVLVREDAVIPVQAFDGETIPFEDNSFDAVCFIDVLHHTDDPMVLLSEAKRVSRKSILIKDHQRDGLLAFRTLQFMDWVGNARYGVSLPYNYWSQEEWRKAFEKLELTVQNWSHELGLYAWFLRPIFERRLHCVVELECP